MGSFSRRSRLLIQTRKLDRVRGEQGSAIAYLVLAIGLVAAAAAGATAVRPVVSGLVEDVGEAAGVEVAAGGAGDGAPDGDGPGGGAPGGDQGAGDGGPDGDGPGGGAPGGDQGAGDDAPDGDGPGGGAPGGDQGAGGGPGGDDSPTDDPSGEEGPGAGLPEVDPVPAESIDDWPPLELSTEIRDLLRDGDYERVGELGDLLLAEIDNMSPEEAEAYIENLRAIHGNDQLFLALLSLTDGSTNPAVLEVLARAEDGAPFGVLRFLDGRDREGFLGLLAEHYDFDPDSIDSDDPGSADALTDQIWGKLIDDHLQNGSLIEAIRRGEVTGRPTERLSDAVLEHFERNPELFAREVLDGVDGEGTEFQRVINLIAERNGSDAVNGLVQNYIADRAPTLEGGVLGQDWSNFLHEMGRLQYNLDNTNSGGTFDPSGIAVFVLKEATKSTPIIGSTITVGQAIVGLDKVLSGYSGPDALANLSREDRQLRQSRALAISALAATNPQATLDLTAVAERFAAGDRASDIWADYPQFEDDVKTMVNTVQNGNAAAQS